MKYFDTSSYLRPSREQLFEEQKNIFIEHFGEPLDVSDYSFTGNLLAITTDKLGDLHDLVEDIVLGQSIENSVGFGLDSKAFSSGLTRKVARSTETYAFVSVSNGGNVSSLLTIGFKDVARTDNFLITFGNTDKFRTINTNNCNSCSFYVDKEVLTVYTIVVRNTTINITASNNAEFINAVKNRFYNIDDVLHAPTNPIPNVKFRLIGDDYIQLIATDGKMLNFTYSDDVLIHSVGGRFRFKCINTGVVTTPVNSLIDVKNSSGTDIVNFDKNVCNIEQAFLIGSVRETDNELRDRIMNTGNALGRCTSTALTTNISTLKDVAFVKVLENKTHEVVDGLAPHSYKVIVSGGDDVDIANTILNVGNVLGIANQGDTTVTVKDINNEFKQISFSRPVNIYLKCKFDLVLVGYSEDDKVVILDSIKQEVIKIINGIDINGVVNADIICSLAITNVVKNIYNIISRSNFLLSRDNGVNWLPVITMGNNEKCLIEDVVIS
jgi:hypothetical protein